MVEIQHKSILPRQHVVLKGTCGPEFVPEDDVTLAIRERLNATSLGNYVKMFTDGYVIFFIHHSHWRYVAYDFRGIRYRHRLASYRRGIHSYTANAKVIRALDGSHSLSSAGFYINKQEL